MIAKARNVRRGARWFSMIISYLQVKSMALWFQVDPHASYESFACAWPFMLDEMMQNATRATIKQLSESCPFSVN